MSRSGRKRARRGRVSAVRIRTALHLTARTDTEPNNQLNQQYQVLEPSRCPAEKHARRPGTLTNERLVELGYFAQGARSAAQRTRHRQLLQLLQQGWQP